MHLENQNRSETQKPHRLSRPFLDYSPSWGDLAMPTPSSVLAHITPVLLPPGFIFILLSLLQPGFLTTEVCKATVIQIIFVYFTAPFSPQLLLSCFDPHLHSTGNLWFPFTIPGSTLHWCLPLVLFASSPTSPPLCGC